MIGISKSQMIACLAAVGVLVLAGSGGAQQQDYQPDPENTAVLGSATQKLAGASPIKNDFVRKPRFLAKLKSGQVWVNSELQLDTDGWPGGKGNTDPTWRPETSWSYTNDTPINANSVPYFVLPKGGWDHQQKIRIGDYAAVIYKGRLAYAVFADRGDDNKLGEGSIQLLRQLGEERITPDGKIINKGMGPGIITIVFPGSGSKKRFANEAALLDDMKVKAKKAFVDLGGNPSAAK